MPKTLYYGDNLSVLRDRIPDESIDLVYLDPSFNSNASYNVLFKQQSGEQSPAQIKAFTDTWEWTQESQRTFEREKAALGLFITLEDPTRDMRTEAVSAGFYHSDVWQKDYPKIQIRTVGELLQGRNFELPPHPSMYQAAQRIQQTEGRQAGLDEAM